jgi:hypothetical protein
MKAPTALAAALAVALGIVAPRAQPAWLAAKILQGGLRECGAVRLAASGRSRASIAKVRARGTRAPGPFGAPNPRKSNEWVDRNLLA